MQGLSRGECDVMVRCAEEAINSLQVTLISRRTSGTLVEHQTRDEFVVVFLSTIGLAHHVWKDRGRVEDRSAPSGGNALVKKH